MTERQPTDLEMCFAGWMPLEFVYNNASDLMEARREEARIEQERLEAKHHAP